MKWDHYWPFGQTPWFSLGVNLDAVVTDQPDFATRKGTEMARPCYQPIPHSHMVYMPDFHAKRYLAGGVIPTFTLAPQFLFRLGFYALFRDRETAASEMHYIVESSLVYHTSLGPVSLSLTKYGLDSWKTPTSPSTSATPSSPAGHILLTPSRQNTRNDIKMSC